jgi:hypothetical protein
MLRPHRARRVTLGAIAAALSLGVAGAGPAAAGPDGTDPVVAAVEQLDRGTEWNVVAEVPLDFDTHHPQGFARVGDKLFMSTVEVVEAPVREPQPDGSDRTPGKGVGHLLVLSLDGELLDDVVVGEDIVYHPGGIDVDADGNVWVPVAEYRPDSNSIVYTVDSDTLEVTERFRFADHVGGIVRDPASGNLHGVSWGSRRLFTWTGKGELQRTTDNPSHYVDFQDCAAAGAGTAVCTGLTEFPVGEEDRFDLGGIAVVDLSSDSIGWEVPVTVGSPAGHVVTRNPVHLEVDGDTLRMLAAPDDGEEPGGTTLLVLETSLAESG